MSKLFITFFIIVGMSTFLTAQEISVAIFYEKKPQGVTLTVQKGSYLVYDDYSLVDTLKAGNNISIVKESEYLVYRNRAKAWATTKDIRIVSEGESAFFINYSGSVESARCYDGWLKVKLNDYNILAINYVPIDSYVSAVVEGQGGGMASEEYFKAQAIMLRTLAVLNYGKHSSEGFDLCDGTHCKMYKKKATNRVIVNASKKTTNLILVDKYKNIVNPMSHLNSGGITAPSEYVWNTYETYLVAVKDDFASQGAGYSWKTLIPAADWQNYLVKKGLKSAASKLLKQLIVVQEKDRINKFEIGSESLSLSTIKSDWGWKSSFFSMSLDKGVITVVGRGAGHGVGLSIESARVMASKGYTYDKILKYFYTDILITDLNHLNIYSEMIENGKKERPL